MQASVTDLDRSATVSARDEGVGGGWIRGIFIRCFQMQPKGHLIRQTALSRGDAMQLIRRIEVNYLRSLFKATVDRPGDLNIIFGRNDSGKSNFLRALNLFFNYEINPGDELDFDLDISDIRRKQARESKGRQFISVRIDFDIPSNYRKSLGEYISIKRQWNAYGGVTETVGTELSKGSRIQLAKFLNQIDFTYIPAIKDLDVFADLIQRMYGAATESKGLQNATGEFVEAIRTQTIGLSDGLTRLFGSTTRLAAPTDMGQLFRSLDFSHGDDEHSLLRQKGDGVKARHLPELLRYINENETGKKYFIWGFEEPENSLDFGAAEAEARSFLSVSGRSDTQVFITSHSPAFYLSGIEEKRARIRRLFVSKQSASTEAGAVMPANAISAIDDIDEAESQMREASLFQLPYLIRRWRTMEKERDELAAEGVRLKKQIEEAELPTLFVEGRHDKDLFEVALSRAGFGKDKVSVRILDGTPKSTSELLPKILASGSIGSSSNILFLFDNDQAGRAAYMNLCKDKQPKIGPVEICSRTKVWALPFTKEFEEFAKKFSIRPENIVFVSEFLFEGDGAARIYADLLGNDGVKNSLGIIHDTYHRSLSQSAAQALREAEPVSKYWLWARTVHDDFKGRFAERATKELDLGEIDRVATKVIEALALRA